MKAPLIFRRVFAAVIVLIMSQLAESASSVAYSDDMLSTDIYLRLSERRCENCALILRDLIEAKVIENTVAAIKRSLNDNSNYSFRYALIKKCYPCYRAAHFWEMNMLNRAATNEEIQRWLQSGESMLLIDYFSASNT